MSGLWCSTIFQSVLVVEQTRVPGENHQPFLGIYRWSIKM